MKFAINLNIKVIAHLFTLVYLAFFASLRTNANTPQDFSNGVLSGWEDDNGEGFHVKITQTRQIRPIGKIFTPQAEGIKHSGFVSDIYCLFKTRLRTFSATSLAMSGDRRALS